MAQDDFGKEDKFDFTAEGEAFGYISLEQARVLAMEAAEESPGNYGNRFRGSRMVYDVVEQQEGEDHYVITLSFRPEGNFSGTPGREQFFIEKAGQIARRQLLGLPRGGKGFPVVPVLIGAVVVAIAGGVVLMVGRGADQDADTVPIVAAVPTPVPTTAAVVAPSITNTPVPSPTSVPTVIPQRRRMYRHPAPRLNRHPWRPPSRLRFHTRQLLSHPHQRLCRLILQGHQRQLLCPPTLQGRRRRRRHRKT